MSLEQYEKYDIIRRSDTIGQEFVKDDKENGSPLEPSITQFPVIRSQTGRHILNI
jgi:hypothetical protein